MFQARRASEANYKILKGRLQVGLFESFSCFRKIICPCHDSVRKTVMEILFTFPVLSAIVGQGQGVSAGKPRAGAVAAIGEVPLLNSVRPIRFKGNHVE